MSIWFAVNFNLLGVGALSLHGHDVHELRCGLIWIVFGWFVLGGLLHGYRGGHL